MNDRELLELAAKAAGVGPVISYDGRSLVIGPRSNVRLWCPLDDDDQALRLVSALKMSVDFMDGSVWRREPDGALVLEYFGGDHDSCYRRAIVRAAAEIGKSMTGNE